MRHFNIKRSVCIGLILATSLPVTAHAQKDVSVETCQKYLYASNEAQSTRKKLDDAFQSALTDQKRHQAYVANLDKEIAGYNALVGKVVYSGKRNSRGFFEVKTLCNQPYYQEYVKVFYTSFTQAEKAAKAEELYQTCLADSRVRDPSQAFFASHSPTLTQKYISVANADLEVERHFFIVKARVTARDAYAAHTPYKISAGNPASIRGLTTAKNARIAKTKERDNQNSLIKRYAANVNQTSGAIERFENEQSNISEVLDQCERAGKLK